MITPTTPSPHYPLISACADRDEAEGIHATALRGWPGRAGSAPCLCVRGDR